MVAKINNLFLTFIVVVLQLQSHLQREEFHYKLLLSCPQLPVAAYSINKHGLN